MKPKAKKSSLQGQLHAHLPILILMGCYLACYFLFLPDTLLAKHVKPGAIATAIALSFVAWTVLPFLAMLVMQFYALARYVKPKHPAAALAKDVWRIISAPECFFAGLIVFAVMQLLGFVFVEFKIAIPQLNPFSWDERLMRLDYVLHLGHHPWELLQPILGTKPVTYFLNFIYNMWFFLMWGITVSLLYSTSDPVQRTSFFLSVVAIWMVGGSLVAVLFSSAGPCYYARLGLTPNPYEGLMHYLQLVDAGSHHLWALATQDMLWESYEGKGTIAGISAMPSLHNATALLFALTYRRANKYVSRALWLYCILIALGSVHLGWHYAVDVYAGWALMLVIWLGTERFAKWWHRPK